MRVFLASICFCLLHSADPIQAARTGSSPNDLPTATSTAQDRVNWLWLRSVDADRTRRYDLAEAFMDGVLAIDPESGHALGSLACYVGKQEKYADALEITERALSKSRKNVIQLMGIKATWLAHMGRKKEADAIWDSIQLPDTNPEELAMYWVCRAFYAARILQDEEVVRDSMAKAIAASPDNYHWKLFFKNDVSFDAYRDRPWLFEMTNP